MAEGGDASSRVRRTQDDSPYSVSVENIPTDFNAGILTIYLEESLTRV